VLLTLGAAVAALTLEPQAQVEPEAVLLVQLEQAAKLVQRGRRILAEAVVVVTTALPLAARVDRVWSLSVIQ
jgi:hypothetical protein